MFCTEIIFKCNQFRFVTYNYNHVQLFVWHSFVNTIRNLSAIGTSHVVTPSTSKGIHDTPKTVRRRKSVSHDHRYIVSPRNLQAQLLASKKAKERLGTKLERSRQKINRLEKKVETLQDIVNELRDTRALTDEGLACLESVADSDLSQLFKRYVKNKTSSMAKGAKSSSTSKYPPELRSFAVTLHFFPQKLTITSGQSFAMRYRIRALFDVGIPASTVNLDLAQRVSPR